ncbi:nuclear transport factor 2 family protein [Enemella sp. A6]|uniref:nuclear transport factor 2 family protein n=1 Tax=Enemella sp. A6 TaxID=3440152 RepID=UPI003EC05B9C
MTDLNTNLSNADIVARFWDAQIAGDRDTARALVHPEMTWTVIGRTHPIARTFHGADGFFGELLGELGRNLDRPTIKIEVQHIHDAGDVVVTEFHETATAKNGHEFVIDIICVMNLADGLITNCREYMDLAEVGAAFPA